jgi:transposase
VDEKRSEAIPAKAQGIKGSSVHEMAEPEVTLGSEKHYRTIPPTPYQRPVGTSYDELQKQVRRDKRSARYEDVQTLSKQGVSIREIARRLKMGRRTVRRFIEAEEYPEKTPSRPRPQQSQLDPYKPYIRERWEQGYRNSVQLYDEIKARGYPGAARTLRTFLTSLRKKHAEAESQAVESSDSLTPSPYVTHRMSSTHVSFLFIRKPEKLNKKQQRDIEQICQGHPDLETAYQLSREFVTMLAEQRSADLDAWLVQAKGSGLPEFKKMVNGIRLDYAAVKAAFSSEWSNGQVEAQVNCLKIQKRIVFGRANFDLLRLRVLCRI